MARNQTQNGVRIRLENPFGEPVLGVGGEMASAVCLLEADEACISAELGHLSDPQAYRNFLAEIERLEGRLDAPVRVIACDMHPAYAATRYAQRRGGSPGEAARVIEVQHHHAHVVSCMAENGLAGRLVGIACDGTGYGTDGNIWGAEVLDCDEAGFRRAGGLRPFPLPGGDAAAIDTWRPAAGMLAETFGTDWPKNLRDLFERVDRRGLDLTLGRLASPKARIVRTSSLGRLFDGVAFLLGLCDRNSYEAEAPVVLESAAASAGAAGPLEWAIAENQDGTAEMDFRPMVRDIAAGLADGREAADLGRAFHETLAVMLAACAARVAEKAGLDRVVLAGGCFVNRILRERLEDLLRAEGLSVYIHRLLSPGDGALALGQAVAAAARMKEEI